jgi:hypothetical protein
MRYPLVALYLILSLVSCKDLNHDDGPKRLDPTLPDITDGAVSPRSKERSLNKPLELLPPKLDTDRNGVRDDIDSFIARPLNSAHKQNAATRLALALEKTLVVDVNNLNAVRHASADVSQAITCVYSSLQSEDLPQTPAKIIRGIESMTTNSYERRRAYARYNKALSRTTYQLPPGNKCK